MASRPRPGITGTTTTIDLKTAYVARDERFGNGDTSKTLRMRLMTSQSMPGVVGDTDGVDTDGVRITCWVMSLDVRERYSPDEGGERVTGMSGSISDDGELDGDEGTDDDGGEYDIGDDEIDEDNSLGMSGSVSNNSISNGSDSNGSDPNKLESSEWCDDRDDILELKELGELAFPIMPVRTELVQWVPEAVGVDNNEGVLGIGMFANEICEVEVRLSKVSDPKEMEDAVETEDGVLVNATWDRCGVSMGVETVVEYGARREGEGTVGDSVTWMSVGDGGDSAEAETDIDTVGVREGEDVTTGSGMFLALLTLKETVGMAPKSKGELTVETSSDQYLGLLRSGLRDNFNDPLGRLRGSDLDGLFYKQVGSNWDWLFDRPGDSLNFLVNGPYDDCTGSSTR
ncbi:hypothetical protein EDB83DRAFT_2316902 [Lactarius deliciosus]|nr:hypothetical protein EDB83DRAFT_2316902 [Lactarius deliciosus]